MLALRRFAASVRCDAELQLRNGLYYATAFVLVVTAAIGLTLPSAHFAALLPAITLNNLAVTSFFFMAALALLERSEGSPLARAVTPLHAGDYLAAKLVTLTALGIVQHLVFGVVLGLAPAQLPLFCLGVGIAAAILALAGFLMAVRYQSINEMLLPAVPWIAALEAPMLCEVLGWNHWLVYLHPMQAAIVLMRAAVEGAPSWQIGYGVGYSLVWLALLWWLARRAYTRWGEVA